MLLLPIVTMLAMTPQDATAPTAFDVRKLVVEMAFDPALYFDDRFDALRITYLGDDYAWPVYAIAIRDKCRLRPVIPGCAAKLQARMVRAKWSGPSAAPARPRLRGSALVSDLRQKGLTSREAIAPVLDAGAAEWLETDLDTCPGAMAELAKARQASWIAPDVVDPKPEREFSMVLHADKITVEFPALLRNARYDGYAAEGSPAAWAKGLAAMLDPCWKPSSATRPWNKPPAPDATASARR